MPNFVQAMVLFTEKKKGWYLVLATIDERTQKEGTYGKKYFEEDEFAV